MHANFTDPQQKTHSLTAFYLLCNYSDKLFFLILPMMLAEATITHLQIRKKTKSKHRNSWRNNCLKQMWCVLLLLLKHTFLTLTIFLTIKWVQTYSFTDISSMWESTHFKTCQKNYTECSQLHCKLYTSMQIIHETQSWRLIFMEALQFYSSDRLLGCLWILHGNISIGTVLAEDVFKRADISPGGYHHNLTSLLFQTSSFKQLFFSSLFLSSSGASPRDANENQFQSWQWF